MLQDIKESLIDLAYAMGAAFCIGACTFCLGAAQIILHVPGYQIVQAGVYFLAFCYGVVSLFFLFKAVTR